MTSAHILLAAILLVQQLEANVFQPLVMHARRASYAGFPVRDGSLTHITIIGTGNMARGIATLVLTGGHAVTLLGRESGEAEQLAGELDAQVATGTVGDARAGEVVVLAVHYGVAPDVAAA